MAVLGLDVDAGERLVEQDDPAFLRQRAGQEHALLLAAGQFADLALAKVAHADALERLVDPVAVGCARHAQEIHVAVAAHHHDVFDQHRKIPVDILALRHIGDDVALQRLGDRLARTGAPRPRRLHEAHDRLEQRRLAAAVDADQRADRAAVEIERLASRSGRGRCGRSR